MNFKQYLKEKDVLQEEPVDIIKSGDDQEKLGSLDSNSSDFDVTISRIRNVIQSEQIEGMARNILDSNGYDKNNDGMVSFIQNLIQNYFSGKADELSKLEEMIINEPYSDYDHTSTNKGSLDAIAQYYNEYLPKAFFHDLFEWDLTIGGVKVGEAEMLLSLMTYMQNSEDGRGDVSGKGDEIEVKVSKSGSGFRPIGQAPTTKSKDEVKEQIRKTFKKFKDQNMLQEMNNEIHQLKNEMDEALDKYKNIGVGTLKSIHSWLVNLRKKIGNNPDISLNVSFNEFMVDITAALTNDHEIQNTVSQSSQSYKNLLDSVRTDNSIKFSNTIAAMQFATYLQTEEFDYFLIVDSGKRVFVSQEAGRFSDIYRFVESNLASFSGWTNNKHAFQISFDL